MAYVSYRKNNSIFATRKQLRIPKGELVLTDGTHLARARCGNRLSDTPAEPTSAQEEPTPDLMMGPLTPASLRDTRIDLFSPTGLSGKCTDYAAKRFLNARRDCANVVLSDNVNRWANAHNRGSASNRRRVRAVTKRRQRGNYLRRATGDHPCPEHRYPTLRASAQFRNRQIL